MSDKRRIRFPWDFWFEVAKAFVSVNEAILGNPKRTREERMVREFRRELDESSVEDLLRRTER